MLAKRIDLGSVPFGLGTAKTDLVRGRLVKYSPKTGEVEYAANDKEAMGFCTRVSSTAEGADVGDLDVIKQGEKPVIYTLVYGNMWLTTEVEGEAAVGDDLEGVADGKLKKASGEGRFTVLEIAKIGDKLAYGVLVKEKAQG